MNTEAKELLDSIKKPKLTFDLLPTDKTPEVTINSHVGGKPFRLEHEHAPICHYCRQKMRFILQLRIPSSETESILYTFHYCFSCVPKNGNKGFQVNSYRNPDLSKANRKAETSPNILPAIFEFEQYWSLPDWESLTILHPNVSDYFFRANTDEFDVAYEETKESFLDMWNFDTFSFFGGYPNFLNEPVYPSCDCCHKPMKLWLQMDSYEEFGILWADFGVLHLFRCEKGNENYKIIIQ